ncbi:MAG TPA: hypothetical protein VF008_12280 [Niastella sp.]
MRRRDFLYNTGLLFPALLASPALALASQKTIKTGLLIIQNEPASLAALSSAINELPVQAHQITGAQISRLEYSQQGFLVTTGDNKLLLAPKIIVQSCRINAPRSSMEITIGQKTFYLNYASANDQHTAPPECWFLKTEHFLANKTSHFINRKGHVVLCLSGS